MRAFFINPNIRTVSEIQIQSDEHANSLLDCEAFTILDTLEKATQILVNRDAYTNENSTGFVAKFCAKPIYGFAILIGLDLISGQRTDLPVTLTTSEVRGALHFMTLYESDFSRAIANSELFSTKI